MKNWIGVLACWFSLTILGMDVQIPLMSFKEGVDLQRLWMNPWGGKKIGACRVDREGGFVELSQQSTRATFSMRDLPEALRGVQPLIAGAELYVTYRIVSMDGYGIVEFVAQTGYQRPLPLLRSGQWETVRIRPSGWHRTKGAYDPSCLRDIYLAFYGSGVIQLREIGLVWSEDQVRSFQPVAFRPAQAQGATAVTVDGQVESREWADAYRIEGLPLGQDRDNPTEVFLKPGPEGLQFAAVCRKNDMGQLRARIRQNSNVWDDESIEFYAFDKWGSGVFRKIAINANGAHCSTRRKGDTVSPKAAARRFADRWEAEAVFPWAYMGMEASRAPFVHVNVTRNCYVGNHLTRSGWSALIWHDKEKFQEVSLCLAGHQETRVPQLTRLCQGSFWLQVPRDSAATYQVYVVSPDGKRYRFRGVRSLAGRQVIPFRVPVTDSGKYEVLAVSEEGGRLTSVTRFAVREDLLKQLPPKGADEFCVFPRPKLMTVAEDTVPLAGYGGYSVKGAGLDYAGQYLARTLGQFYGVDLRPAKDGRILLGLESEAAVQAALDRHGLREDFRKIRFDGFAISVRRDEILIAAKVPAGVVFGAHVLADMVKMTTGDVGEARVRMVRLVDWPRLGVRMFHQTMNSYGHRNKYEVTDFNNLLERFPIDGRFNLFTFELSNYYRWQSVRFRTSPYSWTPEDLSRVVDFVNANGMSVVPCVQSLGHMAWWLFNSRKELKELWEDGDNDVICTRHPKTYPTLFSLFKEYNDIASRNASLSPKYFYTSLDEVWWKTHKTPEEKRCKLCAGIPKNQIFLEHICRLNDYLNAHDQRMIMCSDMIVKAHNGLNEYRCADIADRIPKNVILAHWAGKDFPEMKAFADKGYENWKILTGYYEDKEGEDVVKGYGMAMYTYNWWLTKSRMMASHPLYTILPQRLVMDFAWNDIPAGTGIWKRRVHEYGKFLMRQWSRKPMPRAGRAIGTVSLEAVADTPVSGRLGWFGEGERLSLSAMDFSVREIAGIPVTFARKKRLVHCVKARPEAQVVPLNRKAATLIFLQGAHLPVRWQREFFGSASGDPTYGNVIADYEVVYEDGTMASIPVRYGWNVCEWRTGNDMSQMFSRFVGDCRWLWTGRTALEESEQGHEDVVLYQYEWVNPHPDKSIKDIRLRKTDTHAEYALLALSVREVAKD